MVAIMKRTIKKTIAIAIALAMACTAVLAESVKIDSAHFPDENFRKYIKRISCLASSISTE